MKYATAIRLGTASTEAILRRFNAEVTHPAYAAMLEVGRAQRTIFIARYLRDRELQREINAGLNVVENYNGVNDYIFFGKSGELSSNRREELPRPRHLPPVVEAGTPEAAPRRTCTPRRVSRVPGGLPDSLGG